MGVESTTRQVAKSVGNILEAFLVLFCYEGKMTMPPEGRQNFSACRGKSKKKTLVVCAADWRQVGRSLPEARR